MASGPPGPGPTFDWQGYHDKYGKRGCLWLIIALVAGIVLATVFSWGGSGNANSPTPMQRPVVSYSQILAG